MTIGWVYIAVTRSFPADCKVGFTLRSVPERMSELQRQYRTIHPFTAFAAWRVKEPRRVEWLAHQRLGRYRNPGTELFECPPATAMLDVQAAIKQVIAEEIAHPTRFRPRPQRAPERWRRARPRIPGEMIAAAAVFVLVTLLVFSRPPLPDWLPEDIRNTAVMLEKATSE